MPSIFTPAQRANYDRDGYVIVSSLFDTTEIGLMRDAMVDPFLWGGQQEQDGGVTDGWPLDTHATSFAGAG